MAKEKINRELSIYINDREVVNSLGGITREITKVNNEMRNLNKNSATYDADLKKLQNDLAGLKVKQHEFKEEISATNDVAGSASETFSKLFAGLASGDLKLAKEGLDGIKGSIGGVVKSALAFIATPIGATLAILAGIVAVAREWWNYNESIRENTKLIENLSGKTGKAVDNIRNKITGLSKTFDVEFEAIAKAVDNLVDTEVVRDELEGLELIKNGLLTAPDKNEFIASLESSSLVAKQVGLDLKEVIALKQAIEETGVDPEAVFGALQKGSANLAKQADDLKQKLRDALGAAFADDILEKVKTGEITTVQALEAIGKKANEVSLNQKQQADLTAAIFGKAGIAAGGLITITNTLTDAQNKQTQALTPLQEATKRLADSNDALVEAQDRALKSEGIQQWYNDWEETLNGLSELWYDFVFVMTNGFNALQEAKARAIGEKLEQKFLDDSTKSFETYLERRKKSLGDQFTFEKAQAEYLAMLKKQYNESGAGSWDATESQIEMQKSLEKEIELVKNYAGKKRDIVTGATADEIRAAKEAADKLAKERESAAAKRKAAEEKAAKEAYDREFALAEAKKNLAKAELDFYIATQLSKIEGDRQLTQEIVDEETARLERVQAAQLSQLEIDKERKVAQAEKDAKSQEELYYRLLAIDTEYETAKQNNALQFQQSTEALKQQYTDQQNAYKAEQLRLANELDLATAQSDSEAAAIKQQQDFDAEIDRYNKLLESKKISFAQYMQFVAAAEKKKDEIDKVRQLQQVQGALGGLSQLAGAVTEMFGQSKEMAVTQALINGAQAVTSILAQWPKFDGGFSMYAAIAAAGITTIAQVAKIQKAKPAKQPKFFYGGDTGDTPHLGYDEFGPVTGYVHKNEWVGPEFMTKSPKYAATFTWLEQERQRHLRGFVDGGPASPGTMTTTGAPPPMANNPDLTIAINRLNANLENGIIAKALIGYKEVEDIKTLMGESEASKSNGIVSP